MRSFWKLLLVVFMASSLQACQTAGKDDDATSLSSDGASDAFTYDEDGNIIKEGDGAYSVDGKDLEVFTVMPDTPDNARAYDRVFFSYDSAALTGDSREVLDMQAKWLRDNTDVRITIEGHTDERGTREYNLALGEKRANAVRNYLTASGVSRNRISVVSFGKERPVSYGNSGSAHAKNRRAVTVLNNYN